MSLFGRLAQSWTEGTVLALDGLRRGLTDRFPVEEDPPPVTPYETVDEVGKLRLRYYRPAVSSHGTPLLLVYSLIKRPFILDLDPDRSVVRTLTGLGFDVYVTDWIPPVASESWRGLDAYVNEDLDGAVRAIQAHRGVEQVTLLGYCFGALLTALYTALHQDAVEKLVTLAIPLDMSVRDFPHRNLMDRFDLETAELVTEIYGNCPAWLIRSGFESIAPVYQLIDKHVRRARAEDDPAYARTFARFERWMESDVPLAGQIVREMAAIARKNLLLEDELAIGGRRVCLRDITCPVLNVVGRDDDIVPPASSLALIGRIGSREKEDFLFTGGHMSLAVSASAHAKLWPQVGTWLKRPLADLH